MSLVELGRYARNEAHMVVGLLGSHGVEAIALDGHMSIGEGSAFLIPVRVMVDAGDLDRARALLPEYRAVRIRCLEKRRRARPRRAHSRRTAP